ADPRYGDGTCQLSLDCAVPDIDCIRTFDGDDAAARWFGELEAKMAQQEGRASRQTLPPSDALYVRARELVDRGWLSFRDHRPVGALYQRRPAVVVIDDPHVNAFVMPDAGRAAFTIMVQRGLMERAAVDDQKLGVMMHELQHVIGLHVIRDPKTI